MISAAASIVIGTVTVSHSLGERSSATVAADKPASPVPIPAPRAAMIYQSNSMQLSPYAFSLTPVYLRRFLHLFSFKWSVSPEPYYTTLFSSAHAILSSCTNGCVIASQHS